MKKLSGVDAKRDFFDCVSFWSGLKHRRNREKGSAQQVIVVTETTKNLGFT